jgi:hypothetical protein
VCTDKRRVQVGVGHVFCSNVFLYSEHSKVTCVLGCDAVESAGYSSADPEDTVFSETLVNIYQNIRRRIEEPAVFIFTAKSN